MDNKKKGKINKILCIATNILIAVCLIFTSIEVWYNKIDYACFYMLMVIFLYLTKSTGNKGGND